MEDKRHDKKTRLAVTQVQEEQMHQPHHPPPLLIKLGPDRLELFLQAKVGEVAGEVVGELLFLLRLGRAGAGGRGHGQVVNRAAGAGGRVKVVHPGRRVRTRLGFRVAGEKTNRPGGGHAGEAESGDDGGELHG